MPLNEKEKVVPTAIAPDCKPPVKTISYKLLSSISVAVHDRESK